MHKGSCLCGEVQYKLTCEPERVSHCHCSMCQKQHGAAFATYVSIPESHLVYLSGEYLLSSYHSSNGVVRKFCRDCGSNIEWANGAESPEWVSVSLATFDTEYCPVDIVNIYSETSVCWLGKIR